MLEKFNLLVSTSRRNERNACSEMWYLLKEVGDDDAKVDTTLISGLIVGNTLLSPVKAVEELRKLMREKPWEFRYILKVVPIQEIIPTSVEKIKRVALKLADKINDEKKYRITVRKRSTDLSSTNLIEKIAPEIRNKVDLKNPDLILLIEIIGGVTGLSMIKPVSILSIEKGKRSLNSI